MLSVLSVTEMREAREGGRTAEISAVLGGHALRALRELQMRFCIGFSARDKVTGLDNPDLINRTVVRRRREETGRDAGDGGRRPTPAGPVPRPRFATCA